jgi:hypothetical protein
MRRILTHGALALSLALCAASPAALAKGIKKKKPSPEHVAAVKKCKADYAAAIKAANALKGKERAAAKAKAKADEKQCIADAPK